MVGKPEAPQAPNEGPSPERKIHFVINIIYSILFPLFHFHLSLDHQVKFRFKRECSIFATGSKCEKSPIIQRTLSLQ